MKCKKCLNEHKSKYCPECGAPSEEVAGAVSERDERVMRIVRRAVAEELDARKLQRKEARKKKAEVKTETPPDDFDIFS